MSTVYVEVGTRQVGFKKGQNYFHVVVEWPLGTLSGLNNFRMSVSSKMAEAGGRVIRYVKATLSIFFINLLLKYISSTMWKIIIWTDSSLFFGNFPVFLLVDGQQCTAVADSCQSVLTNKNTGRLEKRDFNRFKFLYGGWNVL